MMDELKNLAKPMIFGLGLVIGIAGSSLSLLALHKYDVSTDSTDSASTCSLALVKHNKGTQTTPLLEPKVTSPTELSIYQIHFNSCLFAVRLAG